MLRRDFLATLPSIPALFASHGVGRDDGADGPESRTKILARVAVIGASVSRGLSSGVPLAALLDYSMESDCEKVAEFADFGMGLGAPASGEKQVDDVLEHEATLVVGLDFLFWYAHFVPAGSDERKLRVERFERGLAQLDRIAAPMVCGDVPAMDEVPEKRLPKGARPTAELRAELNSRIREFAAKRERVLVVPLATWVDELRAGKWRLEGSVDGKAKETLLAPEVALHDDQMHPTTLGALALGERLFAAIREGHKLLPRDLSFDVWKAYRKVKAG